MWHLAMSVGCDHDNCVTTVNFSDLDMIVYVTECNNCDLQ